MTLTFSKPAIRIQPSGVWSVQITARDEAGKLIRQVTSQYPTRERALAEVPVLRKEIDR
jgi:hypothetical protein